jgi:hypothetical protein
VFCKIGEKIILLKLVSPSYLISLYVNLTVIDEYVLWDKLASVPVLCWNFRSVYEG